MQFTRSFIIWLYNCLFGQLHLKSKRLVSSVWLRPEIPSWRNGWYFYYAYVYELRRAYLFHLSSELLPNDGALCQRTAYLMQQVYFINITNTLASLRFSDPLPIICRNHNILIHYDGFRFSFRLFAGFLERDALTKMFGYVLLLSSFVCDFLFCSIGSSPWSNWRTLFSIKRFVLVYF